MTFEIASNVMDVQGFEHDVRDRFADGLNLAIGSTAADQKVIRETRKLGEIENFYVLGFFVDRGLGAKEGFVQTFGVRGCAGSGRIELVHNLIAGHNAYGFLASGGV